MYKKICIWYNLKLMKKNKVMQKTFIGILVIILVVVLFALNNSTTVSIEF